MNKSIENINYDYLTSITGDPFADTGGFVIKILGNNPIFKGKTIIELIEEVTKIYVNKWEAKINAFFLNSTITQPAFQGQRKIDETLKYFNGIIKETNTYQVGNCRITGQETKLFLAGRDNHILSGSGTFINFHHSYESGLLLSKEAIIRMFFVPFGLLQLNDKIALIQSNNLKIFEFFIQQNCNQNLDAIGKGTAAGVNKSEYSFPANALFKFIDNIIYEAKDIVEQEEQKPALSLYHFTNFGASPEVVLYHLSDKIFKFYADCQSILFKKDWNSFLSAHYKNSKFKNVKFNSETKEWENEKEVVGYEVYKNWTNPILNKLLKNDSIMGYFLSWNKKYLFNIKIVENYLNKIRNMDKRALQKVKELADFVVNDRDEDTIKKHVKKLYGVKYLQELRLYLVKLCDDNLKEGKKVPLITSDEYVEFMFPDNGNWREIRDLWLMNIYQKLHEKQMVIDAELEEKEDEIEVEND